MKEIYVKEMPKSCVNCKYFAEHRRQCELELCFQWSEEEMKYNDCPLQSLHDHDKELVAKVCEYIKDRAYENVGYHICECGKKSDIECVDFEDLCEIIDKIQKEFEDE